MVSLPFGQGRMEVKYLFYFWMGVSVGKACQLIFRSQKKGKQIFNGTKARRKETGESRIKISNDIISLEKWWGHLFLGFRGEVRRNGNVETFKDGLSM